MAPTTIDALLGGRVVLEQPAEGFRAGIDAVLLAAAVAAPAGARVLDAGAGTGAAALCLAWRRPDLALGAIEIDPLAAALARGNVERNEFAAGVAVEEGDLMTPPDPAEPPFALVMTNPPFNAPDGRVAAHPGRARAMVDATGPRAWLAACLARLAPGGRLVVIHRADRLPEILAALEPATGAIEIIPLWPGPRFDPGSDPGPSTSPGPGPGPRPGGAAAKRVIVRCRKAGRGPAILRRGLVLHGPTGNFSEAVEAILRHGAALDDVLEVG